MQTRKLGHSGPEVSAIGLGCMAMSGMYGPADRAEGIATIHAALDAGVTLLDTGDFYGMGHNELLIGEAVRGLPHNPYQLSVKFGAMRDHGGGWHGYDARPAAVRNFLTYTLQRLGVDYIDIYRPARLDPQVPIEDTVGRHRRVRRGGLGSSCRPQRGRPRDPAPGERRPSDLRPADRVCADHARHRTRDPPRLPEARHRNHRLRGVQPRPADRRLATGRAGPGRTSAATRRDSRASAGTRNLAVAQRLAEVAQGFGLTAGQLALAWVLAQGEDIVPLVGARRALSA